MISRKKISFLLLFIGVISTLLFPESGGFMLAILGGYDCAACPTDCANPALPDFEINECSDAIELLESEICTIYMTGVDPDNCLEPASKPSDWTSADAWAASISSTGAGIRKINVIGDMPKPESTIQTISKRRKKKGNKTFTVNFDIDEVNLTNYEAMRQDECGGTRFIWIETYGGCLFGGPNGIKVEITDADMPLQRGEDVFKVIQYVVTWDEKCHPPMIESPFTTLCV